MPLKVPKRSVASTPLCHFILWVINRGCNSRKAIRNWIIDKTTNQKILLFNPRIEEWKKHFEWSSDFLKVKGKTLMGKVTVDALQLNRLGVVNIRKLMILGKIHPPLDTI